MTRDTAGALAVPADGASRRPPGFLSRIVEWTDGSDVTRAMRIQDLGEFGLIARIARLTGPDREGTATGIGDDTAVLDTGGARLLLATVDIQVEGRHFVRERTPPYTLGRKTAAINLSDIGAMGGAPRWALISLAVPGELDVEWVDELYRGLVEELGRFDAGVVGGNLSGSEAIVVDLTLLGEVERGRVLRRDGARPGDIILVTGHLGASVVGRFALDAGFGEGDPDVRAAIESHRLPTPRVREGGAIAAAGGATAMLDLSDGLSSDLAHVCEASGVGAVVDAARVPVAAGTRLIAERLGLDPLRLALTGGEDYELLFTAPPAAVASLTVAVRAINNIDVTAIGRITPAAGGRWLQIEDQRHPLDTNGWDHFK